MRITMVFENANYDSFLRMRKIMEILYQLKFCDKRNGIPVCLSDSAGMGSEPGGIFLSP